MRRRSSTRHLVPLLAGLALTVAAVTCSAVFYHPVGSGRTVKVAALESVVSDTQDAYAKGVVDVDLSDLSSLDPDDVTVDNGVVIIGSAGVFRLTGTLDGGHIEVDTKGKVYLELDGVTVNSGSGPALWIKNAKKVTLILAEGSINWLADTATGETDSAALLTSDSLYFTGAGSLKVTGNSSGGISSSDDIVINNGTITVTAAGDGLAANDDITIDGGDVTVTAKGDGLDSNGTVHVNGGRLVAFGGTAQGDGGIDARGEFTITGGTVVAGGNLMVALGNASRQTALYVTSAAVQAAGTTVRLDREDNEVFSYTPAVAYQNVLISSDDLSSSAAYQAYLGDKAGNLIVASK
jgi:hypothetical protein